MHIHSILRLSNSFHLFDIALGASMNGSMASTKQPHNTYGFGKESRMCRETKPNAK
jgi:hypothetical protein